MANLSKPKLPSVSYFCFIFVIFQAFASIDLLEVVICLFSLFTYTKKQFSPISNASIQKIIYYLYVKVPMPAHRFPSSDWPIL